MAFMGSCTGIDMGYGLSSAHHYNSPSERIAEKLSAMGYHIVYDRNNRILLLHGKCPCGVSNKEASFAVEESWGIDQVLERLHRQTDVCIHCRGKICWTTEELNTEKCRSYGNPQAYFQQEYEGVFSYDGTTAQRVDKPRFKKNARQAAIRKLRRR